MSVDELKKQTGGDATDALARSVLDEALPQLAAADAHRAMQAYQHKHIDLATLAGFEHEETEALYARALEQLKLGFVDQSIGHLLALIALKPKDARFLRGLGLCYQYKRLFGWASTVYDMALRHDPDDGISLALSAECELYIRGKKEAHRALSAVVERGVRRPHEQPYVERAKDILTKIKL